nr:thermonuclease family protein [Pseudooceanicola sp. HF7]
MPARSRRPGPAADGPRPATSSSPTARPPSSRPQPQRPVEPALAQTPTQPADPIAPNPRTLSGKCYVIDGDTIVINKTHIRVAGIDCPELDQPWGKKAKFAMVGLCKGQIVTAHIQEGMSYDRVIARCTLADGTDLAAKLVEAGLALDWAKFSGGRYRHLEPAGVRKRLWRVAAKHRGKLAIPQAQDS